MARRQPIPVPASALQLSTAQFARQCIAAPSQRIWNYVTITGGTGLLMDGDFTVSFQLRGRKRQFADALLRDGRDAVPEFDR